MEPYLALREIFLKIENKTILDIDYFQVNKGEIVGLIGENGAGKSTLLRVMALIEKPTKAKLFFDNKPIIKVEQARRCIALVFQDPLLFKGNVYENIAYPLKIRKYGKSKINECCKIIMKQMEIEHLAKRHVDTLSGGEAKRVCLARALVYKPKILLLDEPFGDLDINVRKKIEEKLFKYIKENSIVAVFVSHEFEDIARFCSRLAVMREGEIVQEGALSKILRKPLNRYVASFLGETTFIEAKIKDIENEALIIEASEHLFKIVGKKCFKNGQNVLLNLRPEDIFISNNGAFKSSSVRNSFQAKIVDIKNSSSVCRLKLESGFLSEALITKQSLEELNLFKGKLIVAGFKATAAKLLPKAND